jgi:hypothetical protein
MRVLANHIVHQTGLKGEAANGVREACAAIARDLRAKDEQIAALRDKLESIDRALRSVFDDRI